MVRNVADITPGGVAKALALTRTAASWVIISAPTANAADIRVGGPGTSATVGALLVKGTSLTLPTTCAINGLDLSTIFVYGSATDKVSAIYCTG